MYMCNLLAHPICLCLAMIVYAVHESRCFVVDLVRPRDGARLVLGEDFIRTFMKFFYAFK